MASAAFKIGPLTTYAAPEDLRGWFAGARAGQEATYATGPYAATAHPTCAQVRAWDADGLAFAFRVRNPGREHCFDYKIRKLDPAALRQAQGERDGDAASSSRQAIGPQERDMLGHLTELAEQGRACPTHEGLAAALGLTNRKAAERLFARLVAAGRVRVIEPQRFAARVIEIVATGQRTAASTVPARQVAHG